MRCPSRPCCVPTHCVLGCSRNSATSAPPALLMSSSHGSSMTPTPMPGAHSVEGENLMRRCAEAPLPRPHRHGPWLTLTHTGDASCRLQHIGMLSGHTLGRATFADGETTHPPPEYRALRASRARARHHSTRGSTRHLVNGTRLFPLSTGKELGNICSPGLSVEGCVSVCAPGSVSPCACESCELASAPRSRVRGSPVRSGPPALVRRLKSQFSPAL